jgi:hypothetical protein
MATAFRAELVGKSGHPLTVSVVRPNPQQFIVEVARDETVVASDQFTNGPDAVLRAITMRDEFIQAGWRFRTGS